MMPNLTLSLLGPFQARIADHTMTGFATDKARALLVYLAIEAGIPHRRESLATLLFPDWPDREALNNLRKTLFRLRTALDTVVPGVSDRVLIIARSTIELIPSAVWLDVVEFQNVVHHTLRKDRLTDQDLDDLERVVMLYRGELATGLSCADAQPFEEWLVLQREALHQQALHALDVLAAVYERRAAYGKAQIFVRRALAMEPWREETHMQLIRLLALNGQKSEALTQYESCKRLLDEELGVSPGSGIESLMSQIRDGTLAARPTDLIVSPRALLHRFPPQFTSFVGRDEELDALVHQVLLPDCRLVTIVGAGGIGKTRLSVQAAHRLVQLESVEFTDGLYFVEAAPLTKVEELPTALAMALGLPLQSVVSPLLQIQDFLRARSILLVIDNVEQIISCGTLLLELLAESPLLKIVVTSREPLNVRAEWQFRLEGLSTGSGSAGKAFQLFVQRGRQVAVAWVLTDADEAAIIKVTELVEGSPLALEIAATWLRFYDCATIAREIARGVDFLETELRDVPDRHRSIRTVFDQSWQFLSDREQMMLRQLSVLRGEWTLPQALAVAQGTPREIVSLGDKSLIRRTKNARYTIHELLRQFAFAKLEASDDLPTPYMRYARFFLGGLAALTADLHGMDPRHAVAAVRADWGNIRAAWAVAVALKQWELLLSVLDAYHMVVEFTGVVVEALVDFDLVREATESNVDTQPLYAGATVNLAWWSYRRTDYEQVKKYVGLVVALPDNVALCRWHGQAWYILGMVDFVRGDTEAAESAFEQAAVYFERSGDALWQAHGISARAQVYWKRGDFDVCMQLFQQALDQFEHLRYPLGITAQMTHMGIVHRMRSNYSEALASYRRCVEISEQLNAPADVARQYNNIGTVLYYLRDFPQAIDYYTRALEIDTGLGHLRGAAMEKGNIGLVYSQLYDYERALHYWEDAVSMAQAARLKGVEANYRASRGSLFAELGDFERAGKEIEAGLALARSIDNRPIVANYAGSLAWVQFRLGESAQAMVAMDEAAAVQARFGMRQKLAETLRLKAMMLLEDGEMREALNSLVQSVVLWDEINIPELNALKARVTVEWLKTAVDGYSAGESVLETMLQSSARPEEQAEILYALWKTTGLEPHRVAAEALYQSLRERANLYDYRRRLTELTK